MRQGESSGITGTCPSVPSCCRDRSLPRLLQFIALLSLAVFSKEKTLSRICRITPVPPRWTSLGGLYVSHSDANPGRVLLKSITQCRFFCVLGNIQAVALRDIFVQAQNRDSSPPSLQIEEPEWEKRRSINLSELIDIYR